jgi:hypothetical protein
MPVARATQFHRVYSALMRVLDRLDPSERNQVKSAVITMFSLRSDYTNIKAARECIERIAAKYSQ